MNTKVETRLMSSNQAMANEGSMGFFPTALKVVEMELNLIDFSDIDNETILNICDLCGGTGEQLDCMNNYLKEKNLKSECYFNELSYERYISVLKNYPYFNSLNTDTLELKIGTKQNRSLNKKVFSIIRNNPPYMWLEKKLCDSSVRAEQEFYLKNTPFNITGGIHILELPLHQLLGIKNFLRMLMFKYDIFVAKFPKGEFEKFKQVAVIMKKKAIDSTNLEKIKEMRDNLEKDNIPFLDEINTPVFKVSNDDFKKAKHIDIFRNSKVSKESLGRGLIQVLDTLIDAEKSSSEKYIVEKNKSTIPLTAGHISQLLASGYYNELMDNGLLVKGGSLKELITSTEVEDDGTEVITDTEVLKPYIEITNKLGDILYKNF